MGRPLAVRQGYDAAAFGAWFAAVDSQGDACAAAAQLEGPEVVSGECIFKLMLDTASGHKTKSELHGYGQNDFVPWQLGP